MTFTNGRQVLGVTAGVEFFCSYQGEAGRAVLLESEKTYQFRDATSGTYLTIPRELFEHTVVMLDSK